MTQLKSGVYFVRYQDITKFFQDAEKNGWKHNFDDPQEEIHNIMLTSTRDSETVKQSVIPISLDKRKKRIGFWANEGCFENDVEETMDDWSDYGWSEKHIEFYQSKKIIF